MAAGAVTALMALALALVTTLRMPLPAGMVPTYSRFMWPLGMAVWLALLVAVVDELRARWAVPAHRVALAGTVVAFVGAVAALPTVDNGTAAPRWSMEAVRAIDDDVVAAVEDEGPVLFEMPFTPTVGYLGPPLYSVLQEAGIPFYVDDESQVRQLGEARRYHPGDARVRLVVRGGAGATGGPGERLVASWSSLSDDEAADLERLTDELRSRIARHGLRLTEDADDVLRSGGLDSVLADVAAARDDPDRVLEDGTLVNLWSGPIALFVESPLVDTDYFPADLMDRWATLAERHETQRVRVYVAPIG